MLRLLPPSKDQDALVLKALKLLISFPISQHAHLPGSYWMAQIFLQFGTETFTVALVIIMTHLSVL